MSLSDGAGSGLGMTGARFGSRRRRQVTVVDLAESVTEPIPLVPAAFPAVGAGYDGFEDADVELLDEDDGYPPPQVTHRSVRPYVLTGGRTRPAVHLAIEALVSVPPRPPVLDLSLVRRPEHSAVLELCRVPRSVAEVAALMHVALGVARVLVADLAQSGAVIVHRTSGAAGPEMLLLERVLGGLRKL